MHLNNTVTVVIATHNRPQTLRIALRSVQRQTYEGWQILVIGDNCDRRTPDMIFGLNDDRIVYVPLPVHFGEQAGPNSVGVALAETTFVAFLNHDDIYLADHLKTAIETLVSTQSDMFVAQAAFADQVDALDDGKLMPRFSEMHGPDRSIEAYYFQRGRMFEPSSAWVLRRSFALQVGHWQPSARLYRTPMEDWVHRAWRANVKIRFGETLGVLKVTTHYARDHGAPVYSLDSAEHDTLDEWLESHTPEQMRSYVERDVIAHAGLERSSNLRWPPQAPTNGSRDKLHDRFLELAGLTEEQREETCRKYKETGFDPYEAAAIELGVKPGGAIKAVSRIRTGTDLPHPPNIENVIRDLKSRVLNH